MRRYIVIMELTEDEVDELRAKVKIGEVSEMEKMVFYHTRHLSEQNIYQDAVETYL